MSTSIEHIQQYLFDNKDILEEVINREQNKFKRLPSKIKSKKLSTQKTIKAVIEGIELSEEICNYKLKNDLKIKINSSLSKLNEYALTINPKTNQPIIHIPNRDYREAIIIGAAHENTHAIINELNKNKKNETGYLALNEGICRTVEQIVMEKKFKEENNPNFIYKNTFYRIAELKTMYNKICEIQKIKPLKLISQPNNQNEKRIMEIYKFVNAIKDPHVLGSSLGAIELEKKGQEAIYDMLNLKIGN